LDIPEYSFRIMRNGSEVEISGGFKYGLTDEFLKLLKASRQIQVVHFDSLGGRIGEAEKLYNVIREHGFITYVPSECASACTLAFAGGKQRYVAQRATLGFHGPAFPGMDKADLASSIDTQRKIFLSAGFSPAFVSRAMSTPNSELWKPTLAELLEAKVITGISDGTQFASSGFGEVTKATMAIALEKGLPLLVPLKERLPKSYESIIDTYYESYMAGKTQGELITAARAKLVPILTSLRPLADDDVLVSLARIYADQYETLSLKSAKLCYLYASGADANSSAGEIPRDLVTRELELNERVVRTAAKRAPPSEAVMASVKEKLRAIMSSRGVTSEKLALLEATNVPPSRQGEYCATSIGLFRAIAILPQRDAALFLREIWTDKYPGPPRD
jgi:hypothetical protein